MVPLSIVLPKNAKLDGSHPTLLIGYGSYGITLTPWFMAEYKPWFDRGGIVAVAHPRGGGWYGEAWHQAGMKLTKMNTVYDFVACAQYLVDHGYTTPALLGGEGGSAGGITIMRSIEVAPDLFAAAIDSHGETDMLRAEFTPNGPPNISEFGSVTTEPGFHGLYAMSAQAHVRKGAKYPGVIAFTGVNDPRVEPWEVAKITAALQAASASGRPVLMDVSYDSGHGIGSTIEQYVDETTDGLSFLLWQFGAKDFQPKWR
jgi:prolyl oligopeptidase